MTTKRKTSMRLSLMREDHFLLIRVGLVELAHPEQISPGEPSEIRMVLLDVERELVHHPFAPGRGFEFA